MTDQRGLRGTRNQLFVGRVNRELRRGQTQIGGIVTTTNRDLPATRAADACSVRARTAAGSTSCTSGRTVAGTSADSWSAATSRAPQRRILATQRSSTRYYQRPDARHIASIRRDIDERHGRVRPDAQGGRPALDIRQLDPAVSPGYKINDIGFLQRSDRRAFGNGITYSQRTPGKFWRDWRSTNYVNYAQNFDGDTIDHFYWTRLAMTHLSYWQVDGSVWYSRSGRTTGSRAAARWRIDRPSHATSASSAPTCANRHGQPRIQPRDRPGRKP